MIDYKLYNPVLDCYQYIDAERATGKVIEKTFISEYDSTVTVYVRNISTPKAKTKK